MKVYVNNKALELVKGMTVRHALIHAGLMKQVEQGNKVLDERGNELGLDGALQKDARIYVK